jgi:lipopolysaccharide transport system ATP-binding protein
VSLSIDVTALSKRYRLGDRVEITTLRERTTDLLRGKAARTRSASNGDFIWALKDVSFHVERGQVVGVIGRNGAGKSTLLKILSRITEPTDGRVEIRGRVASLLEVGTGFHPELTGRENVYVNGAILGMRPDEIRRRFDDIVAFAEIDRFIDTPVKRYSSGMYVRLAFAVAAHLQPEILLVDEVLSVGDIGFQRKCLGKINEVSTSGRTVLFVSHNVGAVQSLCSRCLLLEEGVLACDGTPAEAIGKYVAATMGNGTRSSVTLARRSGIPVQVTRLWFEDDLGEPISHVNIGSDVHLCVEYILERDLRDVTIALLLSAHENHLLYSYDTDTDESLRDRRRAGRYLSRVRLPLSLFKEGTYQVTAKIGYAKEELTDPAAHLSIEVRNDGQDFTHRSHRRDRPGYLMTPIAWQTERVDGPPQ